MEDKQTGSFPRYSYPDGLTAGFLLDLFLARPRSFRADARACITRLETPLRVFGEENIPQNGTALITFNHYYRPGFHAWWLALGIAALVSQEIHFGMTGELTFPGQWYAPLARTRNRPRRTRAFSSVGQAFVGQAFSLTVRSSAKSTFVSLLLFIESMPFISVHHRLKKISGTRNSLYPPAYILTERPARNCRD